LGIDENHSTDQTLVTSRRKEAWTKGLQDYEYLNLLKTRSAGKGADGSGADELRQLAEKVLDGTITINAARMQLIANF
jgi:hypothetical protein